MHAIKSLICYPTVEYRRNTKSGQRKWLCVLHVLQKQAQNLSWPVDVGVAPFQSNDKATM